MPTRLLMQLGPASNPHVLLYGGVPLAPGAEQVEALLAEAGLVLCGNPACSSMEDWRATARQRACMAVGGAAAAGQQQGGWGAARGGGCGRIKTCSRCGVVRYCGGACQLQHWTEGGPGLRGAAPGRATVGRAQPPILNSPQMCAPHIHSCDYTGVRCKQCKKSTSFSIKNWGLQEVQEMTGLCGSD